MASVRPSEPPMPTGLPVMKPGYLAPWIVSNSSSIQSMCWALVMTSGAGTSRRWPTSWASCADPAAADPLLLARAEVVRVADDAALAAAERDVDDGALPGHPHGQGADGVDRLLGVEADAALAGAAGVVVLAAEAAEDADAAVVHADGDGEMVLPQRLPQEVPGRLVELEKVGDSVELLLGHLERIEPFGGHKESSYRR